MVIRTHPIFGLCSRYHPSGDLMGRVRPLVMEVADLDTNLDCWSGGVPKV